MKNKRDGYNFDLTKEDALHAYNRHLVSYLRTYERMGLKAIPMRADSGPIGGEDTHEFLFGRAERHCGQLIRCMMTAMNGQGPNLARWI